MNISHPHLSHPKYRPDIDGLRATAVLSVVAFHAFPDLLSGGFIGVDIFFVISGFLITTIILENLDNGAFNFYEFYARRIRRIFPALLIVLVTSYFFGWFVLLADEYKHLAKHIMAGAGFVSNFVLLDESGYFDDVAETKPLLHLWSLGIEEQFYIIWPMFLWMAYKLRFNILILTACVTTISFMLNMNGVDRNSISAFYEPQARFWELLSGGLLAWTLLFTKKSREQKNCRINSVLVNFAHQKTSGGNELIISNTLSSLGLLLLVIGYIVINKSLEFPGAWATIPVLGTTLIILSGPEALINRTLLSNRVVVWFGLISFPLYLWHWPLLTFARIMENETPDIDIRIAAILISIVFAWLTYVFIERPMRFGGNSKLKTILLTILMAAIGYVGYYTYDHDGLTSRFPKIIQDLAEYTYDFKSNYREGTCFLRLDQDFSNFSRFDCHSPAQNRSIVLWGDSHAAHLYQGYNHKYSDSYNIWQLTASACPPILDIDIPSRAHCRATNNYIFNVIKKAHPDRVVLAAAWTKYDLTKLDETILLLKRAGIVNIDVVGPVPQWQDGLPRQLFLHIRNGISHTIPDRMNSGLKTNFIETDDLLRQRVKKHGVSYLSPKEILCNSKGCITMTGETVDTLTAWDYGHLTTKGSEYLVKNFPDY